MNLFVQNIIKNTNYTLVQKSKTVFKSKHIKSDVFEIEQKVIEKIRTMPRNTYEEQLTFLNFCKSVNVTSKIAAVISERLAKNEQEQVEHNKILKSLTESSKRIIQGYEWFLDNGKELFKDEIAEIKEIIVT